MKVKEFGYGIELIGITMVMTVGILGGFSPLDIPQLTSWMGLVLASFGLGLSLGVILYESQRKQ